MSSLLVAENQNCILHSVFSLQTSLENTTDAKHKSRVAGKVRFVLYTDICRVTTKWV